MVLLKNDAQTLPMQNSQKAAVFGITSYDFIAGGTGSGDVNKAYTVDMMTGLTNAGIQVTESLSDLERQLLTDVCDAFHMQGKRVVVILNMGNVIETASWKGQPDAILMAWQPGQEGGNRSRIATTRSTARAST